MSYQSDHLAWQQRVNQEYHSQSSQQVSQKVVEQGNWFNYPDLVDYMRNQQSISNGGIQKQARAFGQNFKVIPSEPNQQLDAQGVITRKDLINNSRQRQRSSQVKNAYEDTGSQYSYAGKSKLLYQRGTTGQGKRSTTSQSRHSLSSQIVQNPYQNNEETKSRLSRQNVSRFNEAIDSAPKVGPKSSYSSQQVRSKVASITPSQKQSVFSKQSYISKRQLMQQKEQEAAPQDIDNEQVRVPEAELREIEQAVLDGEEYADQVGDIPLDDNQEDEKLTSVSQIIPTQSQISQMSGKTYISQLHQQLDDEKVARERLEDELKKLKQVSEEINSHLIQVKKQQQQAE